MGLVSLIFIALTILVAILGYVITPDNTPFANRQFLELTTRRPGFTVKMLKVRKNEPDPDNSFLNTLFYGRKTEYDYLPIFSWIFDKQEIVIEEYTGMTPNDGEIKRVNIADVLYALPAEKQFMKEENNTLFFIDYCGNQISEPLIDLRHKIEKNNLVTIRFPLGTDRYGRDLLSQLIIGTRVSLAVGFISVIISLIVGIFLGSLAGYYGKWIDSMIMWLINVVWSIPTLLLVIAITFALGKGFWQVFVAVGLTMWVEVARVVRGQIFSIREKEFVEAGKAMGFRNFRIIFRHIIPNVMGAVIVISAANFASAILIEAGLSFLGIGVQPPMPSWGTMIKEHYAYIILDSAYLAISPGIAIMMLVLAFMLAGNAMRDALDVKTEIR